MSLDDLEVSVGETQIKGVWIGIVLAFGSTIGGGIWTASEFFSRLESQEDSVQESIAASDTLGTRFDDLRESNTSRLQGMDTKLATMEQAMTVADVENLQGKLSELGANLETIMEAQKELLDLRDRISSVEKTSSETEIKVSGKLESLQTLDDRLKRYERDMDDIWTAIDASNPLGGN